MPGSDVVLFADQVVKALRGVLDDDLVGAYLVGSMALGGYVAGESDLDLVAVVPRALDDVGKQAVAEAVVEVGTACPARGLEFTLYRREVVGASPSPPIRADFEVNANGGPGMPTAVHLDPTAEPGFWFVLDRAVAHRAGVTVVGPPAREVCADVPRPTLVQAMSESMAWHRRHEKASLYSVLNACRAWRFAEDDVLGSKLEGAQWARARWSDTETIDAAVAQRHGEPATLDESAVDALLAAVAARLEEAQD